MVFSPYSRVFHVHLCVIFLLFFNMVSERGEETLETLAVTDENNPRQDPPPPSPMESTAESAVQAAVHQYLRSLNPNAATAFFQSLLPQSRNPSAAPLRFIRRRLGTIDLLLRSTNKSLAIPIYISRHSSLLHSHTSWR